MNYLEELENLRRKILVKTIISFLSIIIIHCSIFFYIDKFMIKEFFLMLLYLEY